MKLSDQEKRIVDYHRNSIKTGNVGQDAQGNPITVFTTTIWIPDGPNKGKFANVPAWVRGKLYTREGFGDNEDRLSNALYNVWKKDIDSGNWPIFNTGQSAGNRAKQVHQIMDDEVDAAKKVLIQKRSMGRDLLRGEQ